MRHFCDYLFAGRPFGRALLDFLIVNGQVSPELAVEEFLSREWVLFFLNYYGRSVENLHSFDGFEFNFVRI